MEDSEKLLSRLQGYNKNCETKCIDLQTLKFGAENGEARLYDDFKSYYFKNDPENPKDQKITHAPKQFCKIIGVPFSFFTKNPEYMKKHMVECWLPSIKKEKAQLLAKIRNNQDGVVLRALLPAEYTNISNADIMEIILNVVRNDFKIELVAGDDRDDLIFHARFITKDTFTAYGEECSTGFSITASDLGCAPISVDTFLYRNPMKTYFYANYSGESFFCSKYEGIMAKDLKELFPKLVDHMKNQLYDIKDSIQAAKELVETKDSIKELMIKLRLTKGLGDKFYIMLQQEIENLSGGQIDRWSFANLISLLSKEYDVIKRSRIERVAGNLIGLNFEKA